MVPWFYTFITNPEAHIFTQGRFLIIKSDEDNVIHDDFSSIICVIECDMGKSRLLPIESWDVISNSILTPIGESFGPMQMGSSLRFIEGQLDGRRLVLLCYCTEPFERELTRGIAAFELTNGTLMSRNLSDLCDSNGNPREDVNWIWSNISVSSSELSSVIEGLKNGDSLSILYLLKDQDRNPFMVGIEGYKAATNSLSLEQIAKGVRLSEILDDKSLDTVPLNVSSIWLQKGVGDFERIYNEGNFQDFESPGISSYNDDHPMEFIIFNNTTLEIVRGEW